VNDDGFLKLKTGTFWIDTIPLSENKAASYAISTQHPLNRPGNCRAASEQYPAQFPHNSHAVAGQLPGNIRAISTQ
jgi:hypothetical protein